ncbi:MAG TPA: hypothetical protein VFX80_06175 [Solirubrobacteraceae bacterium]|nr:hypothetical protein [Solirubrobacteraceae bacterium]
MSFFDEDDEPRSRAPRPRRAAGGDVSADTQTIRIRQAVLAIGLILIAILLLFVFRSCQNSAKENALKDYNREVSTIAEQSSEQIGAEFFRLLGEGGSDSPQDLQSAISSFKVQADQQLTQAERLDVPDEMRGAHQSLLMALEWRRDGLDFIAQRIRTALGDEGEAADEAIQAITGQMQVFLASDVSYETRVIPSIKGALDDEEIGGQDIARSVFMPSIDWLQADVVAGKLGQQLSAGSGRDENEPTGPGLHGTNIDSVSYGDTTLQPGASNQLTYAADSTFSVKFTNGGENDEFDVKVTVKIAGSGDPINLSDTIDRIAPQASATANLALEDAPPTGAAVTITVRVAPVPGEEKTDNNQAEYQAIFNEG